MKCHHRHPEYVAVHLEKNIRYRCQDCGAQCVVGHGDRLNGWPGGPNRRAWKEEQ